MLITIIVMTSTLLACNNDSDDENSEELKYTYEFEDITDINIDVENLNINITNNEYLNKSTIHMSDNINISTDTKTLEIIHKSNKKITINITIPSKNNVNFNLLSVWIYFNLNANFNDMTINSKQCYYNIDKSTINILNINSDKTLYWNRYISSSTINELNLNLEKGYPIISNCTLGQINITNNYGYTEFLKNSFNELNYNSINGKIFMELDPDYGYTFDYNIKSYWSAFEPDQSNPGYYLYGDGERKVNVDAPKGDMEIVKYR